MISERPDPQTIAVVGMSCRFPGANTIEEFWANIRAGIESIEEAPRKVATASDLALVYRQGFLAGIDEFDASFFGYNPLEAEVLDPQHRLFLECCWEALETAGVDPPQFEGSIGVYASCGMGLYYIQNLADNQALIRNLGLNAIRIANRLDNLALRVSHKLNLTGPSVVVQTGCSSSLVAVHLACQALLNGECDIALAGASKVSLLERKAYRYELGGVSSPDGHCRPFDAEAAGSVAGDGVGVVVLRRFEDAVDAGHSIYAVIRGSAINNDGAFKVGFTAPSVEGQAAVIAEALAVSRVEPETIGYIETHGTATPLGDVVEIAALKRIFEPPHAKCALGSVKANIGHTDVTAGIAGLIKVALMLKHHVIPPLLHFQTANPELRIAESPFYMPRNPENWHATGTPRRAAVSSFGIGGANAHVVLEEAPGVLAQLEQGAWQIGVISARTPAALTRAATRLDAFCAEAENFDAADIAHTLQTGRQSMRFRRSFLFRDRATLRQALKLGSPSHLAANTPGRERSVCFLFAGQGAQRVGAGRALYDAGGVYREVMDECAELLRSEMGTDVRRVLYPLAGSDIEPLDATNITQPTLFVQQYAVARAIIASGLQPLALIGHSVGEYVAACLAGVFGIRDALRVVAHRGRLMQRTAEGRMLAIQAPEQDVRPLLGRDVSLAAINAPSQCVVSGSPEAILQIAAAARERGWHMRLLSARRAFHSALMDPILDEFRRILETVELRAPAEPFLSNLTGRWIAAGEAIVPEYWVRHLRSPVLFMDCVRNACAEPHWVLFESGPGTVGVTLAQACLPAEADVVPVTPLASEQDDLSEASLLASVARAWSAGARVSWGRAWRGKQARRVPLPTYSWDHERFWIAPKRQEIVTQAEGERQPIADWFYARTWKRTAGSIEPSGNIRWLIFTDDVIGPAISEWARARGEKTTVVRPGAVFARVGEDEYRIQARRESDYLELFRLDSAQNESSCVVHCWNGIDQDSLTGFWTLLHIAAVMTKLHLKADLRVVTSGLHMILGNEVIDRARSAILGPCRVIPQENPEITVRAIDLAGPTETLDPRTMSALTAELTNSENGLTAIRNGYRWAEDYAKLQPGGEGTLLRTKGVYWILGGLGRIGHEIAMFLARHHSARIAISGLSPLPSRRHWTNLLVRGGNQRDLERTERLRRLESAGAEVFLLPPGDVGEYAVLVHQRELIEDRFGALDGVIHAAGCPGRGAYAVAAECTPEILGPNWGTKSLGAMALDRALEGSQARFCMLFSSLSSILGGLGHSCYAASNSVMDAVALARETRGGCRWMTVNSDGWLFPGDEAGTGLALTLSRWAITPEDSDELFERLFKFHSLAQVAVSTAPLEARSRLWRLGGESPQESLHSPRHCRPALFTNYEPPSGDNEQRIAAVWRDLFGMEEIGVHDNFFELGGHSLLATTMAARLRDVLGVSVSVRHLLENPTVRQLAGVAAELREIDSTQDSDRIPSRSDAGSQDPEAAASSG